MFLDEQGFMTCEKKSIESGRYNCLYLNNNKRKFYLFEAIRIGSYEVVFYPDELRIFSCYDGGLLLDMDYCPWLYPELDTQEKIENAIKNYELLC